MIRPPPELIEEPEIIMDLTEEPEHTLEKQQHNRSQKRSRSNNKQSTKRGRSEEGGGGPGVPWTPHL